MELKSRKQVFIKKNSSNSDCNNDKIISVLATEAKMTLDFNNHPELEDWQFI